MRRRPFGKHWARFFMFRAKAKKVGNETIDANLNWLLGKEGQRFFKENEQWRLGMKTTRLTNMDECVSNPLALVSRYYR